MRDPWNRCNDCGKFIAIDDFKYGALHAMETPDSELTHETWITLCKKCAIGVYWDSNVCRYMHRREVMSEKQTDKAHDLIENYKKAVREENNDYTREYYGRQSIVAGTGCLLPIVALLGILVAVIV